jgi:hypothetical protein
MPIDELGVLQGDLQRQQRLRYTPRGVHHVEAQVPGKVRDEIEPVVGELRFDE